MQRSTKVQVSRIELITIDSGNTKRGKTKLKKVAIEIAVE